MEINGRILLTYLSIKHKGNWDKIYEIIRSKTHVDEEDVEKTLTNLKSKVVTLLDPEYPDNLKEIYKPPFALFYYGDISLINNYKRNIAVVGARNASDYGKEQISNIIKEIAKDYVIVSGLAKGIDTCAHIASIENGGRTIAVLGCGLDYCYPEENKELQNIIKMNHLLISEYPEGVKPDPSHYVIRNRIVVGLSKGVIAIDCKEISGTISSVNLAANLNRDLMSIPYPVGSGFYNNHLINEGANLIENGNDVRLVLGSY